MPVYKRESMQLYHNVVRIFSLVIFFFFFPQDHYCFCVKGLFICLSPSKAKNVCVFVCMHAHVCERAYVCVCAHMCVCVCESGHSELLTPAESAVSEQ